MTSPLRVAVLLGGTSSEHDVSLASGRQVLEALRSRGHEAVPVVIERSGAWRVGAEPDAISLDVAPGDAAPAGTTAREPESDARRRPLPKLEELISREVDVVFIALHGPDGEDGAVQGLLELCGLPYTGSGVLASALAMDKVRAKELFAARGIPVAAHVVVPRSRRLDAAALEALTSEVADRVGFPCIVKPVEGGSSFGTARVEDAQALPAAIEAALVQDSRALVEELVEGVEVTCGVLGEGVEAQVLPVTEIAPVDAAFFDFRAKYTKGACREITPARIDDATTRRVQELAAAAHEALGCEGMSRTDFIVRDGSPVALETNTIPGMTTTSLLPQGAAAAGITFPDLVERLLASARRRGAR